MTCLAILMYNIQSDLTGSLRLRLWLIWVVFNRPLLKVSSCDLNKMRVIFTQNYGKLYFNQRAILSIPTYSVLPHFILPPDYLKQCQATRRVVASSDGIFLKIVKKIVDRIHNYLVNIFFRIGYIFFIVRTSSLKRIWVTTLNLWIY